MRLESLEDRRLLTVDALTATVGSLTLQSDPLNPVSGYVDVTFAVPSGMTPLLAGYNAELHVGPVGNVSFTGAAAAANAVFPGQTPQVFQNGTILRVADFVSGAGQSRAIVDGAGLMRANFSVAAGTSGTFALSLPTLLLTDNNGDFIQGVQVQAGVLTVAAPPSLSIQNVALMEGTGGTTEAEFTVSLSSASEQTVTVDYATADGTATAGSDYTSTSGTLTFLPGQPTTQKVHVPILGDSIDEPTESLFVNLSNVHGATISQGQAQGTITDDDGVPSLTISDITISSEGDAGSQYAVFTVELSAPSGLPVSVDYNTENGSAIAGSDYTATSGTLNFALNEVAHTITVPVTGDLLDEVDEAFFVNLSNASNANIDRPQATATIVDDDMPPTVSIAGGQVTEGNAGTSMATFTVTLSAASGKTVTVEYNTADGSALAGRDYDAASGTVTFEPGTTSQTVSVPVRGDTLNETDETFLVDLSSAVNADLGTAEAEGRILDDDPSRYQLHLAYVVPNNRTEQPETIANLRQAVTQLQTWYRDVMDRYGFGPKTFSIETESDGVTPAVHIVHAAQPDTYFHTDAWNRLQQAGQAAGLPLGAPGEVWLELFEGLVLNSDGTVTGRVELGSAPTSGDEPGLAVKDANPLLDPDLLANNSGYAGQVFLALGSYPMVLHVTAPAAEGDTFSSVSSSAFGTLFHEISHAFGLPHDLRDDVNFNGNVMGNGARGYRGWLRPDLYPNDDLRLSYASALILNSSRYFNAATTYTDNSAPTLSILSDTSVTPINGQIQLQFSASDAGGLSSAVLLSGNDLVAELPLTGTSITTAFSTPRYTPGTETAFTVRVYDSFGNSQDEEIRITPLGTGNRAPVPLLTVPHSRLQINESVTLDASGSTDNDSGLRYEWDIDGNGQFDTEPSTQSTFTLSFSTVGPHLVRVRVTDPSGASSESSPLALRVEPPPSLAIADASIVEGTGGSTTLNLVVSLTGLQLEDVTVQYSTADGTAIAGSDYTARSGTLTFSPGVTSQTISIPITADTIDELAETFFVRLSSPLGATIADSEAIATITDDDQAPTLTITDASLQSEGNAGTADLAFTVTLSAASSQTITVNYSTADGSAVAGTDYTAASGVLTFAPGVTSQTLLVPVRGDTLSENDETFLVNLANPVNASLGDGQATGTIVDDDPLPTLAIADASLAAEGNSGSTNLVFVVTLSASSGRTVTVNYATAAGTAAAGTDFTATNGVLTFAPGATSQTVVVTILGDTRDEEDETFSVHLNSPAGATLADADATGTIVDDDPAPSLSIADIQVTEGNSGTTNATFTVSLSAASGKTVTVNFATANGSAIAGTDYTAANGVLTFAPGTTSQTITVAVLGDTDRETAETFVVNLSVPSNAPLSRASATATINDDELPTLSVADPAAVVEGHTGTTNLVFTVTLSAASSQTVTVQYATANGTATAGSDYTAASGTLTFAPGTTTQTVTVAVRGDADVEPTETVLLNLTSPAAATIFRGQATGTIQNDDMPGVFIADVAIDEGNSDTKSLVFTVTLGAASPETITVRYATADGTAKADTDYTAASGTLTFAPGVTSQTISVTIRGDTAIEDDETFLVNLSSPTYALLGRAQATGTVRNDDGLSRVTGFVYADSNANNQPDAKEGVPYVKITLTPPAGGTAQETWTDQQGWYEFRDVAPGTYQIAEVQPAAFADGGGNTASVVVGTGNGFVSQHFRELALKPQWFSNRLLSTSAQASGLREQLFRQAVEKAEQAAGNTAQPPQVTAGVTRTGDTITVRGANTENKVEIIPGPSRHTVVLNGERQEFDAGAGTTNIVVEGGLASDQVTVSPTAGTSHAELDPRGGTVRGSNYNIQVHAAEQVSVQATGASNDAVLRDSAFDDQLTAQTDHAQLAAWYYQNQVTDFQNTKSISARGGHDTQKRTGTLDFVLATEGSWTDA